MIPLGANSDAKYLRDQCDARAQKIKDLQWECLTYRATLADIRDYGINSKSGTARAMARKAGEALT